MTTQRVPFGLDSGGSALWRRITSDYTLDAMQTVQLEEACRAKDRLDKLDQLLRGDVDVWARLTVDVDSGGQVLELRVTQALAQANATANLMKQLLAALRLPDEATGRRSQYRGPRGVQSPSVPGPKVSSLDRARQAKSG